MSELDTISCRKGSMSVVTRKIPGNSVTRENLTFQSISQKDGGRDAQDRIRGVRGSQHSRGFLYQR